MLTKLEEKCLHTVLKNRRDLPRFVPRNRYFFVECEELLQSIIRCSTTGLNSISRSDLFFLNTIVISRLGKNV